MWGNWCVSAGLIRDDLSNVTSSNLNGSCAKLEMRRHRSWYRLICFWENDKAERWATSRSISRIPRTVIDHRPSFDRRVSDDVMLSWPSAFTNAMIRKREYTYLHSHTWNVPYPRWVFFGAVIFSFLPLQPKPWLLRNSGNRKYLLRIKGRKWSHLRA